MSSNQFMVSDSPFSPPSSLAATSPKPKSRNTKKANPKQNKDQDGKPRRPLSSYNFFFKHERASILEKTPSKYEEGDKPRRSHGKIGFASLARMVASKWNNIEPENRKRFDLLAAEDKKRYSREMGVWKAGQALKKSSVNGMAVSAESIMSGMSLPTVNARSIIKCNLMAVSQASHNSGRMIFSAPANTTVPSRFVPGSFFQGLRGNSMKNANMSPTRGTSAVVGHALSLLEDGKMPSFQPLDEPTLQRVESEESQLTRSSPTYLGRRDSSPHISELAAKLDDECLGFMTQFLF